MEKSKFDTARTGSKPADRGYVGHKSAKMMKRAKVIEARREQAIADKAALFKDRETAEPLKLQPLDHPKKRLLTADGLCIQYGAAPVCAPVRFALDRGERLALCGANGSGKSSVLKLAAGQEIPHSGMLERASGLVVERGGTIDGRAARDDGRLCRGLRRRVDPAADHPAQIRAGARTV